MLGLGKQVLQKIQNLLVEIDKKDNKKMKTTMVNEINKQQQTSRSKDKLNKNHNKSTSYKQNKENICSERIQHLYLNHFIKQQRRLNRNLQNFTEDIKSLKPFKVQNKTSQYINKKRPLKPIHQRANQILLKRQKSIQKIKQNLPKTKEQLQKQQIEYFEQIKKQRHPQISKQQFARKMQQIQMKSIMRIQKLQRQKLLTLQEKQKNILQKPKISQNTHKYWNKKKLKKNLSSNVIQRFEQYDYEKKIKFQNYVQERKRQQTPFAPKLSPITKQLARGSISRRTLRVCDRMTRSLSCHILSKDLDLTFTQRKQDSSNFAKRSGQQSTKQRSIQAFIKQGKSLTTANTSKMNLCSSRLGINQKRLF